MSVAPIEKSKSSTGSLNTSSTSLVISKESGVTLVHPDGKELPENFEYVKPEKSAGMYKYDKCCFKKMMIDVDLLLSL